MAKSTREELIRKLVEFSGRLGTRRVSKRMVDSDPGMPGSATFGRHFGSWKAALRSAGLESGIITGRPQDPPIVLTGEALDVIEGELLGDGSLDLAPTANAYFSHSTANPAYSEFLYGSLRNLAVPLRGLEHLKPRGGKPQTRVRTPSNIAFGELRRVWYPEGTKVVPPGIVLNRTRCLFWYLGDGYVEGRTVKFSTCGFARADVERLASLLSGLGFKSSRNSRSGGYHIVRISGMVAQAFLEWIGPCLVAGYEHKWSLR